MPNFLRMNQDHRSASSSRQRIDHPHPEGLTTRLGPVEVDLKQQIFDVCSSPQQRTFTKGSVTSALCQHATSNVHAARTKRAPRAALNSILIIADQAAINAGFVFRRSAALADNDF
jgi:hypothetical protein